MLKMLKMLKSSRCSRFLSSTASFVTASSTASRDGRGPEQGYQADDEDGFGRDDDHGTGRIQKEEEGD